MTSDRFVLDKASISEFARHVERDFSLKTVEEGDALFLINALYDKAGENDTVRTDRENTVAALDFRVKNTYLFIDVPRALVLFAIGLLDFFKTRGLAALLWGASGRDLRCYARLSPEDGSFCNFLTLEKMKSQLPLDAETIANATAKALCLNPQIGCRHLAGDLCAIDTNVVQSNFKTLHTQRAITIDGEGMVAETR